MAHKSKITVKQQKPLNLNISNCNNSIDKPVHY